MTQGLPRLSLIVSTRNRSGEIVRLLHSLDRQTLRDFEVIVVDQNEMAVIEPFLEGPWPFPVRYLHTPGERGASRGRNRGLELAQGEFITFPDDDCWYPPAFLEQAMREIEDFDLDALTGRCTDEQGNTINGRFEASAQWIDQGNVWTTQIEWIAIWRRSLLRRLGGFDETIGVGARSPWQSAEGQDLMLRALALGARAWYDPDLNGHDEGADRLQADPKLVAKARAYGRGMGFVMRKHDTHMATVCKFLVRPLGGAIVAVACGRKNLAQFYAATAIGRMEGVMRRCTRIQPGLPSS